MENRGNYKNLFPQPTSHSQLLKNMKTIFIADAHLKGLDDPNQKTLCSFLETLKNVDKLFILGDLFEFWTGYNQILEHHYSPVLNQLKKLKQSGTEVIYIEGNHDFSVAPFFKEILGGNVYPDFADIILDGKRVFLAHGDIVEHSISHKIWRSFLRSSALSMIIKITPPAFVWKIAMRLSKKSRKNHIMGDRLEKRQREFARDKIRQGFDMVVLGHSHVPEIFEETIEGKKCFYANPGDWVKEFSYLVYEGGKMSLKRYRQQ